MEPRGVGREGGDEHPAACGRHRFGKTAAHVRLGPGRLGIEDVGRIAHQHVHARIADRGQRLGGGGTAQHRRGIQLPVAGMEYPAFRRIDDQRVGFGDRVGERHEAEAERPQLERLVGADDMERHAGRNALLFQLAAHQPGREGRRVQRHAQVLGKVRQRADMVLVTVSDDDPDQAVPPLFDELEVGEDQVDAGIARVCEGHAAIDHHPFAVRAVQRHVHTDFARSAERAKQQFVLGSHLRS
jgi:hypothetical protein